MTKELPTYQKPKLRAAIYLRVSTNAQAEAGYGLPIQEEKLRAHCLYKGYELEEEHIYRDEGFSGSLAIEKRPALKRLFEDAEAKQIDIIIIYRLDRFFRSLIKLLAAVEQLNTWKIAFESQSENFDTTTLNGKLMYQFIGLLAEHERGVIAERMGNGRTGAARDGKWVTGVPPYGYVVDKETRKLVIKEDEAKIVRQFYNWLIVDKLPLTEIARRANELKFSVPKHATIKKRYTYDIWWKRTIHRILVNEVYTGEFYFRKYKRPFRHLDSVLKEENQRPKEEWIPLDVPAIISIETFKSSLKQLVMNKENAIRNTKRPYLFGKLIYCGYTGHKLQSGFQTPKVDVQSPFNGKYYHTYVPSERPESISNVRVQYAESRLLPVWDCLESILRDPANTVPRLEEYTFKNANRDKAEANIAQLDAHMVIAREREARVVRAYMDGALKEDEYIKERAESAKRISEFEKEKKKLKQLLLKQEERKDRDEIIGKLFQQIESRLDNTTYEEKQYILRLFVERITLFHDKNYAEVVFKFPNTLEVSRAKDVERVSQDDNLTLTLHVKTISKKEGAKMRIYERPGMLKHVGVLDPCTNF